MPIGTENLDYYATARVGGSSRQQAERNQRNQVPIRVFSLLIKYALTIAEFALC